MSESLDTEKLEREVKEMYDEVAESAEERIVELLKRSDQTRDKVGHFLDGGTIDQ